MNRVLITTVLLLASLSAFASDKSMRGEYVWSPDNVVVKSEPPLSGELRASSGSPLFSVEAASVSAPDKLNALRYWNLFNTPTQNGISHVFADEANIEISAPGGSLESAGKSKGGPIHGQVMYTSDGDLIWSTSVEVDQSHRLRLNLSNVDLPEGAKLWVYGAGDEVAGPFGMELASPSGEIWTPSASGPEIKLVVMLPEGSPSASFTMSRVLEIFRLNSIGEPVLTPQAEEDLSCLLQSLCVEVSTFPPIAEVERAIGRMDYIVNGEGFNCTGGLINDSDTSTFIPYFLTAEHCFNTQEVASTLEVYWDWAPDGCNGTDPDLASVPKSNGSTLKAVGKPSDFLFLQLNAIPEGRYFLGYTVEDSAVAPGQTLHRVSNPGGRVQHYSSTTVMEGPQSCGDEWTNATHIWSSYVAGSTLGGSSGSPVLTASGQIVGQLSGSCGEDLTCKTEPTIDGKLSSYWAEVAPFLNPSTGGNDTSDLSIASVSPAGGSYAPGSSFNVASRVDNIGNATSDGYSITFYASTDSSISSGDYKLGSTNRAAIAAGSNDQFNTSVTLPGNIPAGSYTIGAILTVNDSNAANNTKAGSPSITVTGGSSSSFTINAGLNGSWYNASMSGQGILVDVLTESNQVFAAWFTFDSVRPPSSYTSVLGGPGLRWVTALGPIAGNKVVMKAYLASGGVLASANPPVNQVESGTLTLTFHSCKEATLEYNIPGVGSGTISLIRLTFDGVALCESLK